MFDRRTFCPRLWNEAFIDKEGHVFACCHKKPLPIGDIHREKLRDIYNNRIMQELRRQSLSGRLNCYRNCTLLRKEESSPAGNAGVQIDYLILKRLKIAFGDACNIHCIMCHRSMKDGSVLDFEKVKEQVDLTPFDNIEIQGGEPLFIRPARDFFDYASSLGKKVSFLTNGMLIDEGWAKKIALHSAFINFSLNAATSKTHEFINRGSRWELVLENIRKVRDARQELNTPLKIIGHMTIVPYNLEEVPLFIRTSGRLGFDAINFSYDMRVPLYLKCHPFKAKKVGLETRKAVECCGGISPVHIHRLKLLRLV